MIKFIDIITDLRNGDNGKREISYQLSKKDEYTHSMRVNGGSNSGGNVHYLDKDGVEKHIVLHQVPTGILNGKKCIIGSGCVVSLEKLYEEISELRDAGFETKGKLFIAKNCHVIGVGHVLEEQNESKIGTTKQGIGPCYRDKYARVGVRFDQLSSATNDNSMFDFIDLYEEFYNPKNEISILVEMAQGFELDIDHGDYPYVTSSHTTVAGALLNLLPFNKVRKVYGVCKAYDTYVGNKEFQPKNVIFSTLQVLGKEIGATTGRRRQCNWLNIDSLIKAIQVNCVTHLIISKLDVLEELNEEFNNKYWVYKHSLNNVMFSVFSKTKNEFTDKVKLIVKDVDENIKIQWRDAPDCEVKI